MDSDQLGGCDPQTAWLRLLSEATDDYGFGCGPGTAGTLEMPNVQIWDPLSVKIQLSVKIHVPGPGLDSSR